MDRWAKIEEMFHAALALPPQERAEFLRRTCEDDTELRIEVQGLVNQAGSKDAFLEGSPLSFALTMPSGLGPGRTFGNFKILDLIARGGMGIVYKAEDLRLGRVVALKVLPQDQGLSPQDLARFRQEARAASAVDHPNICTIYEIGEHEGRPFIVMQLLEGEPLAARIAGQRLRTPTLIEFGIQILDALEAAHAKGIVHRDIKPSNIFITRRDEIKILDFGLAKLKRGPAERDSVGESGRSTNLLTSPGVVMGTPPYMSPEQVRGEELDSRSDLFSLGVMLYEMATGRRPFTGGSAAEIMSGVLNSTPTPVSQVNPGLPSALDRVINKALEKAPGSRYQRAAEMLSDLRQVKEETESPQLTATMKPREGKRRAAWLPIAVASILLAGAVVTGWRLLSQRENGLNETDTVFLADFANSTGDNVFDETLKEAFSVDLSLSPFLSVLSDQDVNETLKEMGKSRGERLVGEAAREVCMRAGSKAYFGGSIATLGSQYVVELKAVNCRTGESIAREERTASRKEDVLNALHTAARELREKAGESVASIENLDPTFLKASTPSLEAWQVYALGRDACFERFDATSGVPLFQRAIQLDPNFAMAHLSLGMCYGNMGEFELGEPSIRRAFELRDRVTGWEKFAIESRYYFSVTGDLAKARQAYESWAVAYPRANTTPLNMTSQIYSALGEFDTALGKLRSVRKPIPNVECDFTNIYIYLNRLDEGRANARSELAKRPNDSCQHANLYIIAFLQGDQAGMLEQAKWAKGALEIQTAAYSGRIKSARGLSRAEITESEQTGNKENAAAYESQAALLEALLGDQDEAQRLAQDAAKLSDSRGTEVTTGLALALARDAEGAQKFVRDLENRFREDTIVKFNFLPAIRAGIALARSNPSNAIEELRAASRYELGVLDGSIPAPALAAVYIRAQAYLATGQGREASVEFQKILDHRGVLNNAGNGAPLDALAHLGMARAHAVAGDTAKARAAYEDFLTLWKDADADIPILQQAKAEYRKIQ